MAIGSDQPEKKGKKTPLDERFRTLWDKVRCRDGLSVNERLQLRRSGVRVWITRFAGVYLFIFVPAFAAYILLHPWLVSSMEKPPAFDFSEAKDILLATLPIASSIIAFWFGSRPNSQE